MKTIVIAGDSHTWGEGPSGVLDSFSPRAVCGEKRLVGFRFDNYVNLLRRKINLETGSSASDYQFDGENTPFRVQLHGETLLRFQLKETECEKYFTYTVGNNSYTLTVPPVTEGPDFAYETVPVFLPEDTDGELRIDEENCSMLFRLEIYSGNTAVINCGVGSCPSFLYEQKFADLYVKAYKPSVIVTELNTINDWLSVMTPSECRESVSLMLRHFKSICPNVIAHTVSPVLGPQCEPFSRDEYKEYVRAGIEALKEENIPYADVNKIMNDMLDKADPSMQHDMLFDDNWHVTEPGHKIYADEVYKLLREYI